MNVEQSIQPLNVAAATLLIQLLLITLLAVTSSLYRSAGWEPRMSLGSEVALSPHPLRKSPTLFVAIISFATLLISDELYTIWSPIFQGVGINTISAFTAISIVFIVDLLLVGYLVVATGGSKASPFTSALFTIPALAIFLRLPPSMFFTYAVVAGLVYLVLLSPQFETQSKTQAAAAFMNISCLLLSMFTGYITRPVPIDQLRPSVPHVAQPSPSASPRSGS